MCMTQEYELEEVTVLKSITRVYAAKKAASLAMMNEEDKQAVGAAQRRTKSKREAKG